MESTEEEKEGGQAASFNVYKTGYLSTHLSIVLLLLLLLRLLLFFKTRFLCVALAVPEFSLFQASLELRDLPASASASQGLGLKVCTTTQHFTGS